MQGKLARAPFTFSGPTSRYVLAVLLALVGTAVQAAITVFIESLDPAATHSFASYPALLAAVLLSALFCGRGPALLCLGLCTLLNLYFFIEPIYSLRIESAGVLAQLLLFAAIGLMICLVGLERRRVTEQLQDIAHRTQLIVDTALDAVIAIDRQGVITAWNPQAETIFGWQRAEALGRKANDLVIPERYRRSPRGLRALLETGASTVLGRRIELVAIRRDGSEFPVELSITRFHSAGDEYFSGFVRDISERKAAELELRTSEERLRTLAESLPNLVWTCRADGWCDYLSRQWVEYTGRPAEEQLGAGWADHLHPEDRPGVEREWALAVLRKTAYDVEFRLRRHDGVYRWFKTRAIPLLDSRGQVVKWFGSNTDIEDYKFAEIKMRTQLERLDLLDRTTRAIGSRLDAHSILQIVVRSLEDHLAAVDLACVCLANADKSVLTVSCVGARSMKTAEQVGMIDDARIDVAEDGLTRCIRGAVVYEPDLARVESPFARRLASSGLSSVVFAPIAIESSVFGVLIAASRKTGQFTSSDCEFLRQLSEHLALATQQAELYSSLERAYEDIRSTQQGMLQHERLRALGQLASGIAHDINNALSPAALYVQLLLEREKGLSDQVRQQLGIVERAMHDVSQTVARMREFYRPQQSISEEAPLSINRLLEHVIQLTRARWLDIPQERGIVINVQRDFSTVAPDIIGVESEIRDAVTNLILNAVDAMPEGGTVTVRSRAITQPGRASGSSVAVVAVEVSDTGVGMDEQARARCLEPFFTTKGERGTGLGLAMVYGMMQRHRGEIEIESAPGRGTTVRLLFHALSKPGTQTAVAREIELAQPLHILLVDDDPLVLEACRSVLEKDGHTIVTAEGGEAGIESFRQSSKSAKPFDLVITDLGMPYVDGRQVAAAVKAAEPQLPVILMTGWGHRLRAQDEVPEFVDRVLGKPPKLPELRAALAELANGRNSIETPHR